MSSVLAVTQPYGLGSGKPEPFIGIAPGANTNYALQLDGLGVRRLLSLVFTLTTDANAASRYVTVEYQGADGKAFYVAFGASLVTASSTQRYACDIGKSVSDFNTGTDLGVSLAPIMLYPGNTLNILVASKQAGDTLTLIRGVFERFPLDPERVPVLSPE